MKNIKLRELEKYNNIDYGYIDFGVYFNHLTKKYHLAIEYKLHGYEDPQYPLSFFLEKYGLTCTEEFNGTEIVENGEIKAVAEIITESDTRLDLLKILSLSSIVEKEVTFVEYEDYYMLVLIYGIGKVFFDDRYAEVPVVGSRNSEYGLDNFEYDKDEYASYKKLAESISIDANVSSQSKLQYVLLTGEKVDLVFYDEYEYKVVTCNIDEAAN